MLDIKLDDLIIDENKILSSISLTFPSCGLVYISGVSGSGKTTLLKALAGEIKYNGTILYNGNDIQDKKYSSYYKQNIVSTIDQECCLFDSLTVKENLEIAFDLNNQKNDKNKILELANSLNIIDLLNVKCSKLSGGERQRVVITRSLLRSTPILIADELISALDETNAKIVLDILEEYSRTHLVIIASHQAELLKEYDFMTVFLDNGKIKLIDNQIINYSLEEKKVHSNFSFKNTFKLSFEICKKNLVSLIILCICVLVCMISTNLSLEFSKWSQEKEIVNLISDYDLKCIKLTSNGNEQKEILSSNGYTIFDAKQYCFENDNNIIKNANFISLSDAKTKCDMTLKYGCYPVNEYDICISNYFYEKMFEYGFNSETTHVNIKKPEMSDIIGTKIYCSDIKHYLTITGIIDSYYNKKSLDKIEDFYIPTYRTNYFGESIYESIICSDVLYQKTSFVLENDNIKFFDNQNNVHLITGDEPKVGECVISFGYYERYYSKFKKQIELSDFDKKILIGCTTLDDIDSYIGYDDETIDKLNAFFEKHEELYSYTEILGYLRISDILLLTDYYSEFLRLIGENIIYNNVSYRFCGINDDKNENIVLNSNENDINVKRYEKEVNEITFIMLPKDNKKAIKLIELLDESKFVYFSPVMGSINNASYSIQSINFIFIPISILFAVISIMLCFMYSFISSRKYKEETKLLLSLGTTKKQILFIYECSFIFITLLLFVISILISVFGNNIINIVVNKNINFGYDINILQFSYQIMLTSLVIILVLDLINLFFVEKNIKKI